jgi:hypothetical protein
LGFLFLGQIELFPSPKDAPLFTLIASFILVPFKLIAWQCSSSIPAAKVMDAAGLIAFKEDKLKASGGIGLKNEPVSKRSGVRASRATP